MSTLEQIFLHTGLTPQETAERLAPLLGMRLTRANDGKVFLGRSLGGGQAGEVGGEISANYLASVDPEPDEVSVLDDYDTLFEVWSTVKDEQLQRAEAGRLFTEIVSRLPWPAVLVHNLDRLVAAWTHELGRRDFPAGTSPDADDEALWAPYKQGQ